ncbi:MAG: phage protease [Rhodocyclaceae bacterium]|nr:phage protease [Rhodocyclaceae bacterium]
MSKVAAPLCAFLAALPEPAAGFAVLLPAGRFRARDGRPGPGKYWECTEQTAAQLIADGRRRGTPYVIDYEHQTLNAKDNGHPAPAAGFFQQMEFRPGVGLVTADLRWTDRAAQMIRDGEYQFLSPVFTYDDDCQITGLVCAGLTNLPATDGTRVAALTQLIAGDSMDIVQQLIALLGLAAGATPETILQAVQDLVSRAASTAACKTEHETQVAALKAAVAAAQSAAPDPTKFVPIGVMTEMQTRLAALTTQVQTDEGQRLIDAALNDGRLLPEQKVWAQTLAAVNVAHLKTYLASAKPLAILAGTQTAGKPPAGLQDKSAHSEEYLAVCKQLGIEPEKPAA